MTKRLFAPIAALALLLAACSDDNGNGPKPDQKTGDMAVSDVGPTPDKGPPSEGGTPDGPEPDGSTPSLCGSAPDYDTASKINAFLEGKTVVMEGANIPSHPLGYDEDVNFETATQCYKKVTMKIQSGNYNVTSELGTLQNAPNKGDKGTCDHTTKSTEVSFTSTVAKVENVATDGSCYDFTVTYTGFAQEGRGCISPDGKKLMLEIFFKDQAVGHRCGDGAVGGGGITLNGKAFNDNAVQVFEIQ
jgi:hypothetical protein